MPGKPQPIEYCPETGKFTRNGRECGTITANGYVFVSYLNKIWLAHRLAWHLSGRELPEMLDHINGIRHDNRLANLRPADARLNGHNQKRARKSASGLLGVYPRGGRFQAKIKHRGISKCLGTFDTALEAHEAYAAAKFKLHEYAGIND